MATTERVIESFYAPDELVTASPGRRLGGYLIDVTIVFEQSGGNNSFVNITGTYNYAPIVPLVIPTTVGGSIDFTKLQMDIVSTTRMALVIP